MGRSSETFNKKENEKKKQKKQKDKELKKEERKASGGKKSFEDMLAYVDEDGNITDTPPDPNVKKKKINVEDIEIGIPKQEDREEESKERTGVITFFNDSKGYGFIKDSNGNSVFVHVNGLADKVGENDKVIFEVEMGHKGLNAVNVKLVK